MTDCIRASARLVLFLVLLLAACQPAAPASTPTLLPTATEAPSATPSPSPTFTPTPTPTGTPTPTPAPTLTPTYIPLQPLFSAPWLSVQGWSPDGRYLAFLSFPEEVGADYRLPPGTLHFFDSQTGQMCAYPYGILLHPYRRFILEWMPDGQVSVYNSRPAGAGTPCGSDFRAIPARSEAEMSWDYQTVSDPLSSGAYTAVARFVGEAGMNQVRIEVTDDQTGKLVAVVPGIRAGSECGLCGVEDWMQWLDEETLLVPQSPAGPLLVRANVGITSLLSLVGAPGDAGACTPGTGACADKLVARAVTHPEDGAYHILLTGGGSTARLYHAETGQSETLENVTQAFFTPGGRWLVDAGQFTRRAVDPPGSPAEPFPLMDTGPAELFPAQSTSPDGETIAIHFRSGFAIYDLATTRRLAAWETGDSRPFYGSWSPGGRYLAVQAAPPSTASTDQLYVVPAE